MSKYIAIGAGGFLGAVSRYAIGHIHIYHYKGIVPINTLFINVTGSFIIALILTVAIEVWEMNENIRLGLTTGFLGAYTTFSTLCKETVTLITKGYYYSAISYMTMSIILGLAGVFLGIIVARELVSRVVKEDLEEEMDA